MKEIDRLVMRRELGADVKEPFDKYWEHMLHESDASDISEEKIKEMRQAEEQKFEDQKSQA